MKFTKQDISRNEFKSSHNLKDHFCNFDCKNVNISEKTSISISMLCFSEYKYKGGFFSYNRYITKATSIYWLDLSSRENAQKLINLRGVRSFISSYIFEKIQS